MNTFQKTITLFAAAATLPLAPLAFTGTAGAQTLDGNTTNCGTANRPASTTYAAFAELSPIAEKMQLTGTTYVLVDIDENGAFRAASVGKTSGSPLLDNSALEAARASTFQPEIRDCKAVGGEYLFKVDFPKQ